MTLLEKAKATGLTPKLRKELLPGELDLCLAWLTSEVSTAQACRALGADASGQLLYRVASVLRDAVKHGHVTVTRTKANTRGVA